MRRVWRPGLLSGALALAAGALPLVLYAAGNDWPIRDGDAAGRRYSTLTQITPANVSRLEKAWELDTGTGNLQVTPVVVSGVMYLGAGSSIWALEPETAKTIWKFDAPDVVSRRGVAYWPGDRTTSPRIISGAGERMVALDAKTGRPVSGFRLDGYVDLKQGIVGSADGRISLVSPPTLFKDIIITGGNNGEQSPSAGLYGDIRGWDVRTGKLLWSFHTVPREGEPGNDTWEAGSWKNRSGTNTWSFFTVDTERGIVYAPIGSPTADYYGGDRKGQNLFGNSSLRSTRRLGGCAGIGNWSTMTSGTSIFRPHRRLWMCAREAARSRRSSRSRRRTCCSSSTGRPASRSTASRNGPYRRATCRVRSRGPRSHSR